MGTLLHVLLAVLAAAHLAAQPPAWKPLFDGKTLEGWRETPFTNQGKVQVESASIVLLPGSPLTGITWAGQFPKTNYEIRFDARRVQGNDLFACLTFPVDGSFASWVAGGWGGDIVGMSSLDGWDASENETRSYFTFENGRWYSFRLEVRPERVRAWIDGASVFDVAITGRQISLRRGEIRLSAPLGFASFATRGEIRDVAYRELAAKAP
ncbi:MAG: DUF1080 domain-containing protein [Bryobacterales bacterium]|nr:DUF1080 domain-containing protein [Bryobacterales bacterium]